MSFFGARFSSAVTQLRGELSAAPQTASDTIVKLVEKINTSAAVDDRRTAVLGLKGLSRDWKADVGKEAFPALLAVLKHDAPYDTDIAKAVLETLMVLCEVPEKPAKDDVGLRHCDIFLETPEPFHAILGLISNSPAFFSRFYSLQFLSQIVTARPALAQSYILSAPPPGVDGVLDVLDPKAPAPGGQGSSVMGGGAGEMLRNEALLLLPGLLAGNADLQKIIAFSGAFERTLDIIRSEGGIEGGIVVQDALTVIGTLLRFNVSNQNLFRELSLIPSLPPILHFPTPLAADEPAPDTFALQDWPEQKLVNAGLVLGLVRMLIGGPGGGNQSAMANGGVTRALLELSLASNAPNGLKCQALNTLTPIMLSSGPNQALLSTLMISPLVPVEPDYEHPQGGFIRLPPRPAAVALVAAVIEGDPSAGGKGLRGRAAGVNMFEAFVTGNDDTRIGILSSMVPPPEDNPNANYPDSPQSAGSLIISGLLDLPTSGQPFDPYRSLFSCLLLAHLIRHSEHGKKLAREIKFPSGDGEEGDDDEQVSLLQLIVGNLMMASREQADAANRAAKDGHDSTEEEDWTRVMVGYLVLLSTWLWDSPKSVKEFLGESANLQVLIGPITQPTGIDPLVQGLCAFLLGVCYEFNREPGEITRATLHPILHSRIGPDQFVSRMARLREDPRFRAVQPDAFDTEGEEATTTVHDDPETDDALELWFDWAFVDFWKNSYYTIQRAIAVEPDAVRPAAVAGEDAESVEIIASLREKLRTQTAEVVSLQSQLSNLTGEHGKEKDTLVAEIAALREQLASAATSAAEAHAAELDSLRAELATAREEAKTAKEEAAARAETKTQLETTRGELETAKSELELARHALSAARKKVEELEKGEGGGGATGGKKGKKGKGAAASDEAEKEKEKEAKEAKEAVKKLEAQLADAKAALEAEKDKAADQAKEQEDLLVLLEELTQKRKADKKAMREKGMDVSEDEDDGDDEEDDE